MRYRIQRVQMTNTDHYVVALKRWWGWETLWWTRERTIEECLATYRKGEPKDKRLPEWEGLSGYDPISDAYAWY